MRWLLRFLLFWAISTPLFYIVGLPLVLDHFSTKIRDQNYTQCITHLASEGLMGAANAAFTQAQGENYCHCMSDDLTFTQADLWDAVQRKPPAALTAMAQAASERCGKELRAAQGFAPAIAPAPEDIIDIAP